MPTTEAGKAVSSLNAVQHGILAQTAAIPGVERLEDWQAHRQGLLDALAPQDDLELCLAERAAVALWRLNRVTRYECESVALSLERVPDDVAQKRRFRSSEDNLVPHTLAEAELLVSLAERARRLLEDFPSLPDDAQLPFQEADTILDAVTDQTENVDLEELEIPGFPTAEEWDLNPPVSAACLRAALAFLAEQEGSDLLRLYTGAQVDAREDLDGRRRQLAELQDEIDRERRARRFPEELVLNRVMRYEAHLSRELYRALRELKEIRSDRREAGERKNGSTEEGKNGTQPDPSPLPHLHPSAPPPCPDPNPQSEIRNPQSQDPEVRNERPAPRTPRPPFSPGIPDFAREDRILPDEPPAPPAAQPSALARAHFAAPAPLAPVPAEAIARNNSLAGAHPRTDEMPGLFLGNELPALTFWSFRVFAPRAPSGQFPFSPKTPDENPVRRSMPAAHAPAENLLRRNEPHRPRRPLARHRKTRICGTNCPPTSSRRATPALPRAAGVTVS